MGDNWYMVKRADENRHVIGTTEVKKKPGALTFFRSVTRHYDTLDADPTEKIKEVYQAYMKKYEALSGICGFVRKTFDRGVNWLTERLGLSAWTEVKQVEHLFWGIIKRKFREDEGDKGDKWDIQDIRNKHQEFMKNAQTLREDQNKTKEDIQKIKEGVEEAQKSYQKITEESKKLTKEGKEITGKAREEITRGRRLQEEANSLILDILKLGLENYQSLSDELKENEMIVEYVITTTCKKIIEEFGSSYWFSETGAIGKKDREFLYAKVTTKLTNLGMDISEKGSTIKTTLKDELKNKFFKLCSGARLYAEKSIKENKITETYPDGIPDEVIEKLHTYHNNQLWNLEITEICSQFKVIKLSLDLLVQPHKVIKKICKEIVEKHFDKLYISESGTFTEDQRKFLYDKVVVILKGLEVEISESDIKFIKELLEKELKSWLWFFRSDVEKDINKGDDNQIIDSKDLEEKLQKRGWDIDLKKDWINTLVQKSRKVEEVIEEIDLRIEKVKKGQEEIKKGIAQFLSLENQVKETSRKQDELMNSKEFKFVIQKIVEGNPQILTQDPTLFNEILTKEENS